MNIKDMNPVVNVGTEKSPLMVLDATIMVLKYERPLERITKFLTWMTI